MRQKWMNNEEWLLILISRIYFNEQITQEIEWIVDSQMINTDYLEELCIKNRVYPQLLNVSAKY